MIETTEQKAVLTRGELWERMREFLGEMVMTPSGAGMAPRAAGLLADVERVAEQAPAKAGLMREMTKLESYAGDALMGLLANPKLVEKMADAYSVGLDPYQDVANDAFNVAEAMVREGERRLQ